MRESSYFMRSNTKQESICVCGISGHTVSAASIEGTRSYEGGSYSKYSRIGYSIIDLDIKHRRLRVILNSMNPYICLSLHPHIRSSFRVWSLSTLINITEDIQICA